MSNGALTSFRSYCFAYILDTLEAQLGFSLFDRGTTRKPKLTPQGEAVVSEARAVAHSVETLRARVRGFLDATSAWAKAPRGSDRFWRTFVVWDRRSAVVHRHSLHVRHRFGAADPGPVIRRALLDIWAVKSSILERSSLRIGEVFALL